LVGKLSHWPLSKVKSDPTSRFELEYEGATVLTGVWVTLTVDVEVRKTGLFPGTSVQALVAVNPAITKLPATEAGRVNVFEDSSPIAVQLLGIVVRELDTEVAQEYQAIVTAGVGVPVTVAVERISDPTCMVPLTVGVEENTGAEVTAKVEELTMSVNTVEVPLATFTAAVALTLATINFPASTDRTI
jgi:hypothetical protein